jgi:hypothetical protein
MAAPHPFCIQGSEPGCSVGASRSLSAAHGAAGTPLGVNTRTGGGTDPERPRLQLIEQVLSMTEAGGRGEYHQSVISLAMIAREISPS